MTAAAVLAALVLGAASPAPSSRVPPAPACTSASVVEHPCRGLLVPIEQGRTALTCIVADLPSCRARAARDRALCVQSRREAAAVEANLRRRIVDASPSWWESPWLGAAVGAAVGLAAGVAVAVAVRR